MSKTDKPELALASDKPELVLRIVMPSVGDMELLQQNGGTVDLLPIFYGEESMGPHVQVLSITHVEGKETQTVLGRFRLKLRSDGRLEFKRGSA